MEQAAAISSELAFVATGNDIVLHSKSCGKSARNRFVSINTVIIPAHEFCSRNFRAQAAAKFDTASDNAG